MKQWFIFFLFGLSGINYAQEILNWQECVRRAKENNPEIISAKEKINQSKAEKNIAISRVLPKLESDAGYNSSLTSDTKSYSAGLSLRQLVFDGLRSYYSIKAADENLKSSLFAYHAVSANVRLRLRLAYIELLKNQELRAISVDIESRREKNKELVKLRYNIGREHKGALLTSEARLASAQFDSAQSKRDIELASVLLQKQMGSEKFGIVKLGGDFEVNYPDFEDISVSNLIANNYSLLELLARKRALEYNVKSSYANFSPNINLGLSYSASDNKWFPSGWEWRFSLNFSLPLFEGGSRLFEVSKTKSQLKQINAEAKSKKLSINYEIKKMISDFKAAKEKIEVQEKFLQAAEERAKIAQAQYSAGLLSFDNWTLIEDELANTKRTYLEARADAMVKEANWLYLTGRTLDEE